MTFPDDAPHFWTRAISGLAGRINRVLWLERFAPAAFAGSAAAAIAIHGLRRLGMEPTWGWILLSVCMAAAGVAAWWLTRQRRFTRDDARVLLEYRMRLDSGLTAAELGLAQWPVRTPLPADVVRWRSRSVPAWLAGGLTLVAAAAWLPVSPEDGPVIRPHEKPPALVQTEEWLENLAQLETVDPESVEPLAERAAELARQSPENQYTHSGLEAADALKEQTAAAMQGLAHALESAAGAMASLEQSGAALTPEQLKAIGARLDAALRGVREGTLKISPELLKACEACAGAPGLLTAEQAAQLKRGLGKAGQQIRGVLGAEGAGAMIAGPDALVMMPGAGRGGVDHGPGEAPLTFSENASDVAPAKTETVANDDRSRASLGDLLGTQTGEHDLDPAKAQGLGSAGAPAAAGAGGEAVWVNRLTPAERAALSSFFK